MFSFIFVSVFFFRWQLLMLMTKRCIQLLPCTSVLFLLFDHHNHLHRALPIGNQKRFRAMMVVVWLVFFSFLLVFTSKHTHTETFTLHVCWSWCIFASLCLFPFNIVSENTIENSNHHHHTNHYEGRLKIDIDRDSQTWSKIPSSELKISLIEQREL